jgi:DivIVA domain-containing protein
MSDQRGTMRAVEVLFVVLALALVGGIAVVAAGGDTRPRTARRGNASRAGALPADVMLDARPDRPPLGLPAGRLAPDDLDALRFSSALRGYRMDQVDEVLDRLRDELIARDEHIAGLERELERRPWPS